MEYRVRVQNESDRQILAFLRKRVGETMLLATPDGRHSGDAGTRRAAVAPAGQCPVPGKPPPGSRSRRACRKWLVLTDCLTRSTCHVVRHFPCHTLVRGRDVLIAGGAAYWDGPQAATGEDR
jgi:hypothetical protein